jgi:hypothetical protein
VAQLYKPYLLMSESIDEHNLLRSALQQQIQPDTFIEHIWVHDNDIDRLVNKWFTNKAVRRTVSGILRTFGLDEASIDAEAFRLSIADIALFDRRMAELERRREDILRQIEDHRAGLASKVTAILDQPAEYNALLPHRAGSD